MHKDELRAVALSFGMLAETFDRQWDEFVEFRDLVEGSADRLGIARPSARFSAFGLAMLDAKTLGEFSAMDRMVR